MSHYHGLHPHHFQDRQEQGHHGPPATLPLEDPEDENRLIPARFRELLIEVANHLRNRHIARVHLIDGAVPGAFQQVAERLDQVEQRNRQARVVVLPDKGFHLRVRPDVFLDQALLLEHLGGVLETLVFEKPLDEFLSGIFLIRTLRRKGGIPRQQHLRLNMYQSRRHVDEFGPQVHIHLPRLLQILQILGGDGGDGNVLDVDLLLADQVQQQVQRALVLFQVDVQRRHCTSR